MSWSTEDDKRARGCMLTVFILLITLSAVFYAGFQVARM